MSTIKIIIISMLLFPVMTNAVLAQNDSLEHYLEIAVRNNPGVKADFLAYRASLQKIPQAGAIPDPQLDMGFFLPSMEVIGGRQIANLTLRQMFPWFGTRKVARTEAGHKANRAFEKFRESRDNLYLQVYTQWFLLCSLRQQLINSRENKDYLAQLETLSLRRFSAPPAGNPGSMSEELRIQLEIAELENSIESILSAIKAETAAFNALLDRPADSSILLPDSIEQIPFLLDVAGIMEKITGRNPMLGMINEEESAYKAKAEMDKKMSYPMLGVGLQYSMIGKRMDMGRTGIPVTEMNGMDMIMPMVSVSIPVYRNKYKAQQKESSYLRQASREAYSDTRNGLEAELYRNKHQLDDAARKITLYEKQTKLALTTYNLAVREFVAGKSELTAVIQVQRQLLDYRLKKAEAVADYNTMVAAIQKLVSFNDVTID